MRRVGRWSTPWNRKSRYSARSIPPVASFTVSVTNRLNEPWSKHPQIPPTRLPVDVGGLVFLDDIHEDQQARIDEIVPAAKEQRTKAGEDQKRANRIALMLAKVKVPLGIERLQSTLKLEKPEPAFGMSPQLMEEFNYLDQQLKTRE